MVEKEFYFGDEHVGFTRENEVDITEIKSEIEIDEANEMEPLKIKLDEDDRKNIIIKFVRDYSDHETKDNIQVKKSPLSKKKPIILIILIIIILIFLISGIIVLSLYLTKLKKSIYYLY